MSSFKINSQLHGKTFFLYQKICYVSFFSLYFSSHYIHRNLRSGKRVSYFKKKHFHYTAVYNINIYYILHIFYIIYYINTIYSMHAKYSFYYLVKLYQLYYIQHLNNLYIYIFLYMYDKLLFPVNIEKVCLYV